MTTTIGPTVETASEDPSQILLSLVVSLLAPMFLSSSNGNVVLAHRAAYQTVMAYRTRSHVDLLIVGQIVGFGLAVLHAISLSLTDNIPIPLVLRCLATANACSRSGEQKTHGLEKLQARDPVRDEATDPEVAFEPKPEPAWPMPEPEPACATPEPTHSAPEPDTFLSPEAEQLLAAESQARLHRTVETRRPQPIAPTLSVEQENKQMWAGAMLEEAAALEATLPSIPPDQRSVTEMKVSALNDVARDLLEGAPMPLSGFAAHMRAQPGIPPIR